MPPYAGAPVTQAFRERWLSGKHIGDSKPVASIEVRRGRLVRRFHPYDSFGLPAFGDYPGALGIGFWYPDWEVDSPWTTLDTVTNIRLEQSFDGNGITTATLKMDNLKFVPTTGNAGILYHLVEQGYYAPLRGFVGIGRPDPGITKTPMYGKLPNAQIRIKQGYGADQTVTTFLGLIDDLESTSRPNEMTLTARDFGGVLVDEHFFGWAKEMVLPSPLTFAPRKLAEQHKLVGADARASTTDGSHDADNVLKRDDSTWQSATQDTEADTQWVEITLPEGKYSQMFFGTLFNGMHGFIGLKPTAQANGKPPSVNGEDMTDQLDENGWFDPLGRKVPGHFGGWSYLREWNTKAGPANYFYLGDVFFVGDGTVLRVGFRNLVEVAGGFAASVTRLQGNQRKFTKSAVKGRWILIDDVSDIVKCCLRWAGFKTWEVESTGVNLQEVYVADPAKTFMDVINVVKEMVGYTFFIGEPRDDNNDQDLGYPIFRNNRVFENSTGPTEFIDDKLLLTDAKVKISNLDDRCMIRCRGISKKDGVTIDGDSVKRLMFAYIPPWAGEQAAKVGGVIKSITHTDPKFTTLADCQFGCYLIALQIALSKYSAIITVPANPGIGVDTLQSIIDRIQGLNSRLYITNRTQEMQIGKDGFWTMELGGALADTPDVDGVVADFLKAIKILDRGGKNPWLRKRDYGYEEG